jgi:Flp pilus assembly protein protease CpaA
MKWPMDYYARSFIFLCGAIPATLVDIKKMRIPDVFSVGAFSFLVVLDCLFVRRRLLADLAASALVFCMLAAIKFMIGGIGSGDLKYAAMVSFFSGFPHCFLSMTLASISAALFFLIAIVVFSKSPDSKLPFAPFLTGGAILTGFFEYFRIA